MSSHRSQPAPSFLSGVRYEHLLAGVSGGVISTCVLHPLDLLKIRFVVTVIYVMISKEIQRERVLFLSFM